MSKRPATRSTRRWRTGFERADPTGWMPMTMGSLARRCFSRRNPGCPRPGECLRNRALLSGPGRSLDLDLGGPSRTGFVKELRIAWTPTATGSPARPCLRKARSRGSSGSIGESQTPPPTLCCPSLQGRSVARRATQGEGQALARRSGARRDPHPPRFARVLPPFREKSVPKLRGEPICRTCCAM